jgi:hypothetical protein
MDRFAVECILDWVGRNHVPPGIDVEALGAAIEGSGAWYDAAKVHGSDGRSGALHPPPDELSARIAKELYLNEHPPFTFLVGKQLVVVFERHFGARASIIRDKDTGKISSSPYLRFAEAAVAELSKPPTPWLSRLRIGTPRGGYYSRETIAKAVTNIRSGKPRRKT